MKTQVSSPEPQGCSQRSNPLAGFLKAAVVILLVAGAVQGSLMLSRAGASRRAASRVAGNGMRPGGRDTFAFRKARVLADVRTFAAVVHYLLEAEPRIQTNLVASAHDLTDLPFVPAGASRLQVTRGVFALPPARVANSPARG